MQEKLQLIHIFNDDKFIDTAIELFELVIPNQSQYYVIKKNNETIKYVKSTAAQVIVLRNNKEIEVFANSLSSSNTKVVCVHALDENKSILINNLPHKIIKVWFSWGYDLYPHLKSFRKKYFEAKTFNFLESNKQKQTFKKRLLESKLTYFMFLLSKRIPVLFSKRIKGILNNVHENEFKRAVKKIDVFVPVILNEYELLKYFNIKPKLASFEYVFIEQLLEGREHLNVLNAKNILVGNSADPSNNHEEVFRKISQYDLGDRKVYVPLSYSGNKRYIDNILEKGKYYLKENFVPLTDFMPLEEYNNIVQSCGFLILNHIRQQAVGNIVAFGYLGAKVFLNEKSPVYKYFKELGVNIYSTQRLDEDDFRNNLSLEKFKKNQEIYIENYSKEAVKNKTQELIKVIKECIRVDE